MQSACAAKARRPRKAGCWWPFGSSFVACPLLVQCIPPQGCLPQLLPSEGSCEQRYAKRVTMDCCSRCSRRDGASPRAAAGPGAHSQEGHSQLAVLSLSAHSCLFALTHTLPLVCEPSKGRTDEPSGLLVPQCSDGVSPGGTHILSVYHSFDWVDQTECGLRDGPSLRKSIHLCSDTPCFPQAHIVFPWKKLSGKITAIPIHHVAPV